MDKIILYQIYAYMKKDSGILRGAMYVSGGLTMFGIDHANYKQAMVGAIVGGVCGVIDLLRERSLIRDARKETLESIVKKK